MSEEPHPLSSYFPISPFELCHHLMFSRYIRSAAAVPSGTLYLNISYCNILSYLSCFVGRHTWSLLVAKSAYCQEIITAYPINGTSCSLLDGLV